MSNPRAALFGLFALSIVLSSACSRTVTRSGRSVRVHAPVDRVEGVARALAAVHFGHAELRWRPEFLDYRLVADGHEYVIDFNAVDAENCTFSCSYQGGAAKQRASDFFDAVIEALESEGITVAIPRH
jgi:hypothetical protein